MPRNRGNLADPRPDPGQEGRHDGREHGTIVHELLDPVEERLAPLPVHLDRLVAEERISSTSSIPGVKDTNRYGPAPTGAFLKPSSPTRSAYFFGTIQAAPVAGVA